MTRRQHWDLDSLSAEGGLFYPDDPEASAPNGPT